MPPPPLTRNILRSDKSFPNEKIVKDVGKWVESVKELKSTADNDKIESQKINRVVKKLKKKKSVTKPAQTEIQNPIKTDTTVENIFANLKDECINLKLPPGWIAGTCGNNIIFNRFKVTSFNSVYKMTAERGVLLAPDRTVHVFLNGTETPETDWVSKKIETIDDVKKVIKDADNFKICSKASKNFKPNQMKSTTKPPMKKQGVQKKETM